MHFLFVDNFFQKELVLYLVCSFIMWVKANKQLLNLHGCHFLFPNSYFYKIHCTRINFCQIVLDLILKGNGFVILLTGFIMLSCSG